MLRNRRCRRAVAARGGRLVLLSPQAAVREVLGTAGVDQIVPVADDVDAALAALGA